MAKKSGSTTTPEQRHEQIRTFVLPNKESFTVQWKHGKKEIGNRVHEIGKDLFSQFTAKGVGSVTLVSILTGGLVFTADLIRALNDEHLNEHPPVSGEEHKSSAPRNVEEDKPHGELPRHIMVHLEFIKAKKYEGNTPKELQLNPDLLDNTKIMGQHIILVDDVVDTGETLRGANDLLRARKAASVTPVVLLLKRDRQQKAYGIKIDPAERRIVGIGDEEFAEDFSGHIGFVVGPEFLVGNGMDYKGALRNLSWIGAETQPRASRKGISVRLKDRSRKIS